MVLEPLIRDRIAIARPAKEEPGMLTDIAGFAIWASVSEEVDAKIREQIKAGTFPVRLKPEDWQSGSVNWLLDVIAPDRKTAGRVIANFAQVVKTAELRLHPQIGGLVEKEMLEKMGASQAKGD
jgi:cytolysin-activating lysine-acyltransferase